MSSLFLLDVYGHRTLSASSGKKLRSSGYVWRLEIFEAVPSVPSTRYFFTFICSVFPKRLEIIDMLVCELCIATIITFGTRGTYYLYQSGIPKSSNQGRMSWDHANEPTCYVYVIGVFA